MPKTLELKGLCIEWREWIYLVYGCRHIIMQVFHHWSWHTIRLFPRQTLHSYVPIIKSRSNLRMRRRRNTGRHGYTSNKWRHKGSHFWSCHCSGCCRSGYSHFRRNQHSHGCTHDRWYIGTHCGADVCVNCACEEDCNDCDDAEPPLLVDLYIVFKALPLLKCMHTIFTRKVREMFEEKKETYFQNLHKQGPTGWANLVAGVFGKQEGLVLVITSKIKPEILGHVV